MPNRQQEDSSPHEAILKKMQEDSNYSAQAYFEAAKIADLRGRALVFVPALIGAIGSILVAFGGARQFSSAAAIATAVAATASFLGPTRDVVSFKESGRKFTKLRHRISLEQSYLPYKDFESAESTVREIRKEYDEIVSTSEPTSNRAFKRASKNIESGFLDYASRDSDSEKDHS